MSRKCLTPKTASLLGMLVYRAEIYKVNIFSLFPLKFEIVENNQGMTGILDICWQVFHNWHKISCRKLEIFFVGQLQAETMGLRGL